MSTEKEKIAVMAKTAAKFGLKVGKGETIETLKKKLVAHFVSAGIGLDFKCPTCDNEIPDMPACPFCGQTFSGTAEAEAQKEEAPAPEPAPTEPENAKPEPTPESPAPKKEAPEKSAPKTSPKSQKKATTATFVRDEKKESSKKESPAPKKEAPKTPPVDVKKATAPKREKKSSVDIKALMLKLNPFIKKAGMIVEEKKSIFSVYLPHEDSWRRKVMGILPSKWNFTFTICVVGFNPPVPERNVVFTPEFIVKNRRGAARGTYKTPDLDEAFNVGKQIIDLAESGKAYIRGNQFAMTEKGAVPSDASPKSPKKGAKKETPKSAPKSETKKPTSAPKKETPKSPKKTEGKKESKPAPKKEGAAKKEGAPKKK